MPDYSQGKIYIISSQQTDKVYIGSTTLPLTDRFSIHKSSYCKNHRYTSAFELLKYEDATIELVEEFPCKNKEELLRKEGEIMKETLNCVNMRTAGRTQKEWIDANKEALSKYRKAYKEANKETILAKQKAYREANKEALLEYQRAYHKRKKEESCEKNQSIQTSKE